MANLKNITDLPVVESSEGLNLIVNDNGAAKQISANAIGKVKTVNSVAPDDNGNVNIEIPEGFSGSVGLVQRIDVFIDGDTYTCDKTYDELQELVLKGVLLYAVIRYSDGTIYLDGGFYVYSHYYYPDDDQLRFYRGDGRYCLIFSSNNEGKEIRLAVLN